MSTVSGRSTGAKARASFAPTVSTDVETRASFTHTLVRRHFGNPIWDGVLRLTAAMALLAIPLALFVPAAGGLVGFFIVTVWVNGPISPFLPSTYEPILMLVGRVYPSLLVAAVGVVGTLYVEYLNYHLYRRVLQLSALERMKKSATVVRVLRLFSRAPFFTVWLSSWSVIPYWPVRFISPLAGYPVWKHLTATFLGRFPRLWFFAALGAWWSVSTGVLVAISLGSIVVAVLVYFVKRGRRPADPATDSEALEASLT